jgi:hypothetical protein
MNRFLLLALALAACDKDKDTATDGDDTSVGTDTDTATDNTDTDTDTELNCAAVVLSTEPANGATAVYYRDPVVVSFDGDGSAAVITVMDAGGSGATLETAWSEGDVQASLSGVLLPATVYTISVDVCGVVTASTFTTSSLGSPLAIPASDLLGRAYVWRLSDATITEPAFLDFVASSYLTVPLLIGVTASDDTSIDLLGGVGYHENDGAYTQVDGEETWDFPAGDFADQPYFEAYSDYITVSYNGIPIPIEQFHLSGTFTADGTAIQKGVGSGFGDSRYMGPLLMQPADAYDAVCNIAAKAGVSCVPCSDGEPYCIYIVAEDITAEWEEGLTIVQTD